MKNKIKKLFSCLSVVLVFALCAGLFVACGSDPVELTSNMIMLEYTAVDYDGTEKTPTITIKNGEDTIDPEEYTVTYSNNKNVGTASVKIEATEKSRVISGSVSIGFEITQATATATTLAEINTAMENSNFKAVQLSSAFTLNQGETLTIEEGFVVNFGNNVLTNYGTIVNNGVLIENKAIDGYGVITNNGEIRAEVSNMTDLQNATQFASRIVVMADISQDQSDNKFYIANFMRYKELEIDLNGHSVQKQFRFESKYGSRSIKLTNSSENEAVITVDNMSPIIMLGHATTQNAEFNVEISNIKIIGDGANAWAGISTNGTYKNSPYFKVSVKNCVIDGETSAGVYLPGGYTYKFEDCTISGYTAYYTKGGTHELKNCTLVARGNTYNNPIYNNNGADETGSALVLDSASGYPEPLVMTIDGGSFSSVAGFAVEEYATSANGIDKFYSTLTIKKNPSYSYGAGKTALSIPQFMVSDCVENAETIMDQLFDATYNKSSVLGTQKTYNFESLREIINDAELYVEVGTIENISNVNKLTIGLSTFTKDQEISTSIGMGNFIKDKAFYVDNNKLYIAVPILVAEMQNCETIEINGKTFEFELVDVVQQINVTELNYRGASDAEAVVGSFNEYNLTIADAVNYLEIFYSNSSATDKVVTRKIINGSVSYGLTTVESYEGNPLGLYPVGYYKDFANVPATYDNVTFYYTIYVVGKGVTTLKLNLDLI